MLRIRKFVDVDVSLRPVFLPPFPSVACKDARFSSSKMITPSFAMINRRLSPLLSALNVPTIVTCRTGGIRKAAAVGECNQRLMSGSPRHTRVVVFVLVPAKESRCGRTGFCQRSDRSSEMYCPFRFQPLACVYLLRVTTTICLPPKLNAPALRQVTSLGP